MTPTAITTIEIQPSTNVRSTRNEAWLLSDNITYEYLEKLDTRRLIEKGKAGTLAARKKQLEIAKAHKDEIKDWVVRNQFRMPLGHFAVWFYVPMPRSWRKKKRAEMLYTEHQSTPDLDNFLKQLFDCVMPRKNRMKREKGADDRKIFSYTAFKVWVTDDESCMKILEYKKEEFDYVFRHGHPGYKEDSDSQ